MYAKRIFGVVYAFFIYWVVLDAQPVKHESYFSFEEPDVPAVFSVGQSVVSVSDRHFKDGKQSLRWDFEQKGTLSLKKDLLFEPKDPTGKDTYLSVFIIWIYNEKALDTTIRFEFLKDGKVCTSFPFGINFTGWRAAWVCYERDMEGIPEVGMNELRITAPDRAGTLYIDPDEETLSRMQKKREEDLEKKALLEQLKGKENITKSGQKINVYANIGNASDVGAVLKNDAGGIGLFRSEFLYLENETFPTEEQQFAVYKQVAENMAGKKVIIRTLDIGADKQVDYFELDKEENPALGYRAIRICLTRPEIFKTQLRALYRAAFYGNISIMFPMIISVSEIHKIKEMIKEVKAELKEQGIPYKEDVELGVMIETPASVMISRELAKEVDFFSVGTNDLTQYTLAIDRQNSKLDEFYDPHHPAVLAMIRMAAENAHAEGKWIGICGELGADLELTEEFLKMGLDELSVSPSMVLPLRKKIRDCE